MADIVLKVTVPANRRLVIDLPPEAPEGEVEIVIRPSVVISENYGTAPATAAEILASPLFGLWKDRDDMVDSAAYVERMRREEEERRNPWKNRE